MYVLPFSTIAHLVGLTERGIAGPADTELTLNIGTLRLLLQFVALAADYDEAVYLAENPDVAQAYETKQISDLRLHFVQSGYFEGRRASKLRLEEDWYLKTYPDVADAVKEGVVASAQAHFTARGAAEMRSPNAEALPWVQFWADAFARSRVSPQKSANV